jgi:hypothetical protein
MSLPWTSEIGVILRNMNAHEKATDKRPFDITALAFHLANEMGDNNAFILQGQVIFPAGVHGRQ